MTEVEPEGFGEFMLSGDGAVDELAVVYGLDLGEHRSGETLAFLREPQHMLRVSLGEDEQAQILCHSFECGSGILRVGQGGTVI